MTRFYKLSGAGNDFLALVEPASFPDPSQIVARCRRGVSAGADGLFVLERHEDGVRMHYFNCDGEAAALCINGTRCAARLAFELGWAGDSIAIVTDAGSFTAWPAGDEEIVVEVPAPDTEAARAHDLEVGSTRYSGWWLGVGVPHFVVPWEGDIGTAPVSTAGRELRSHPQLGAAGANVDFVRYDDPHRLSVRSYERGVEAETLACGTGILAATAIGIATERCILPVSALTRGGFVVRLEHGAAEAAGDSTRWRMRGDARLVATGELAPGADRLSGDPWS